MNGRVLALGLPLVAGFLAWTTGNLAWKLSVPGSCALLLVLGDAPIRRNRDVAWVVLAFAASRS